MEHLHMSLGVLIFLVVLALAFDFMNGFHDAANAIATVVSTRVLKPHQAVMLATFFNFIAIFVFHLKVAATVGKGTVDPSIIDHYVVFGALSAAIGWNILTWYYGIPSSSSHALIGGLIGAAIAKAGFGSLISAGVIKTVAFIFISPLVGMLLGGLMMLLIGWGFRKSTPRRVENWSRRLQLVSASAYALGHGGNDAQKTVGIIWILLISAGALGKNDPVPMWVVVACYAAIGLGTAFGGWRIIRLMGQKITKLTPVGGFAAQTAGSAMLFFANAMGIPVSTTHTITGAIVGVGANRKLSAVRWGVAGTIVWAWIFTIPCTALLAALLWWIGLAVL